MDIFYTSSPDSIDPDADDRLQASAGAGDTSTGGQEDEAHDEGNSEASGQAGSPDTPAAEVHSALQKVVLEDARSWQRLLEQSGFTHAEAGRLIFERVRPRDEGLVRS